MAENSVLPTPDREQRSEWLGGLEQSAQQRLRTDQPHRLLIRGIIATAVVFGAGMLAGAVLIKILE